MKIRNFKRTLINGFFVSLPLLALIYFGNKILNILARLVAPLAQKIGIEAILGKLTLLVLAFIILLIGFYIMGLFLNSRFLKHINQIMDPLLIKIFPDLRKLKSKANIIDETMFGFHWEKGLLQKKEYWVPVYVISKTDEYVHVYESYSSDGANGSFYFILTKDFRFKPLTTEVFLDLIQNYTVPNDLKLE